MIGIIVWLVLAILVGVFANNKGRSGVGFFLLAVLLSPLIGLVIALLVSPNEKALESEAIANGGLKKCPHCAELVKEEANLCKHCQSPLEKVINTIVYQILRNGDSLIAIDMGKFTARDDVNEHIAGGYELVGEIEAVSVEEALANFSK